MYKTVEVKSAGQPLRPSLVRGGQYDVEKSAETLLNKRLYGLIILLILSLCSIMLGVIALYYRGNFGTHLNGHQPESITNSPSNQQESFKNTLKKFEHTVKTSTGYTSYSILLTCNTTGQANLMSHYWYKDDNKIDTLNGSKYILKNRDLKIKNLTENDAGTFTCLLIDGDNYEKSVSYNLIIEDAYKWVFLRSPKHHPAYWTFTLNNQYYFGQLDIGKKLLPGLFDINSDLQNGNVTFSLLPENLEPADKDKILRINKNVDYKWIDLSNDKFPPNALEAGKLDNGEKLYFAAVTSLKTGLIDTSNKEKYELYDGDLKIKNLTVNDAGIYKCLLIYDANYKEVSYNLIMQDAYKWVEFFDSSEIEDPAYEKFYFNNKFNLGQLDTGESLVPGVFDGDLFSTIKMFSDELDKSDFFKILMIKKNVEYDWVEDSNGHVPSNALEAGEFNGEKFYIGSTLDSQQLGVGNFGYMIAVLHGGSSSTIKFWH
ncbi:hypothetical protein HCN44_011197 [Aphidius gifuensis]|uniref:Ig-like domain-containing protein n=1 Tax=Aphidius gifuensis TaxID=684658 RepID=A0A834XUV8_APHGI|nr:hypothetical protein HCN44_011197 [Aphidius gifuensis]